MSGIPYLTQEWLDMSTAVMEPMPPCPGATFVMQCVMTDAPGGGDVVFHRVFDDGRLLRSVLAPPPSSSTRPTTTASCTSRAGCRRRRPSAPDASAPRATSHCSERSRP